MFTIRFFSKVAFICNLCFIAAVIIQVMPHPPEGELVATTIIVGYLFAIFINAAFNILLALAFLVKKEINKIVPRWLIISNLLFLIPELIMISK